MQAFFDAVVSKLPVRLQPYAKSLVPFSVGVVVAAQDFTVSVVEVNELKVLGIGAVTSLLVLFTRNIGK
jgi:hypothetical protein